MLYTRHSSLLVFSLRQAAYIYIYAYIYMKLHSTQYKYRYLICVV